MPEKINFLLEKLAALLGPGNVSTVGKNLIVKPASTQEIVEVIKLAQTEKVGLEPVHYVIGPGIPPSHGSKIILSMERMNKIRHFDRDSLCLMVEPAVPKDEILKIATDHGLLFTGTVCHHKQETIGENIVTCFNEGEPDFKCRVACISGLEMALLDGELVTIDGSSVKEVGNYSLSYILAGHRENPAILTGMYLKMLPTRTDEFFLIAAFKKLEDALESLPALLMGRDNLKNVMVLDASFVSSASAYLNNLFPEIEEQSAYAIFTMKGVFPQLEPTTREIAGICHEKEAQEVLIADGTYQKEMISSTLDSFFAELIANKNVYQNHDFPPQKEFFDHHKIYRLTALIWQNEPESRSAFYIA